jgi:hypothetical protein
MKTSTWAVLIAGLFSSFAVFANPPPFVSNVPEPETYAMLLLGLGVLGFIAKRNKKKY